MMHECKRLLNHSTAAEGLLVARSSTQSTKATSMDPFLVPQPTDADADADSDATEHATEHAADGDATEHAPADPSVVTREPSTKRQRRQSASVSEEQPSGATEFAERSEDDCDEVLPAANVHKMPSASR